MAAAAVALALVLARSSQAAQENSLILILIDGYRWDYTAVHGGGAGLPGFQYLETHGGRAEYLNPVFPTISNPNWLTISTGLYPDQHGIIGNNFYDPERKAEFSLFDMNTTQDPAWWGDAEPLWITATKGGLDTALLHWSRCDVPWKDGTRPRHCERHEYDATGSLAQLPKRLSRAVDMIETEGYRLVMVYEDAVDTLGHYKGPLSPEVKAAVGEVDQALQGMWSDLQAKGMTDKTNVVLVSDHGMKAVKGEAALQVVEVGHCLHAGQVEVVVNDALYLTLHPSPGMAEQVVESMRSCEGARDKVKVYHKKEVPPRYHFKDHRLVPPVLVIPGKGYILEVKEATGVKVIESDVSSYFGNHGFDNTEGQHPDMRGVLYAAGPAFARGGRAGAVEQVDVYGLLCHALSLPCNPHQGNPDRTAPLLRAPPPPPAEEYHHHHYQDTTTTTATTSVRLVVILIIAFITFRFLFGKK